jgi:tetratricopeptide (TPR) repeat protein
MKTKKMSGYFFRSPVMSFTLPTFLALFLASGCVAIQVGGEIQQGRNQLRYGDPKVALAHFQRAAELDPNYVLNYALLYESVGTYVGRAYYDSGNLPQARRALEAASRRHDSDHMAKLYLGLTLARDGGQQEGLKRIEAGLRGLREWLDRNEHYNPDGRFWDPGRQIRGQIQSDLAMISGKEINWPELIASGEQLGKKLEEEIDFVIRDRWKEQQDSGKNDSTP